MLEGMLRSMSPRRWAVSRKLLPTLSESVGDYLTDPKISLDDAVDGAYLPFEKRYGRPDKAFIDTMVRTTRSFQSDDFNAENAKQTLSMFRGYTSDDATVEKIINSYDTLKYNPESKAMDERSIPNLLIDQLEPLHKMPIKTKGDRAFLEMWRNVNNKMFSRDNLDQSMREMNKETIDYVFANINETSRWDMSKAKEYLSGIRLPDWNLGEIGKRYMPLTAAAMAALILITSITTP